MYTGAESFKQSKISPITPYVFYYKLPLPKQDIEICVDCRSYGNFARFVRRSCKPNAEVSFFFQMLLKIFISNIWIFLFQLKTLVFSGTLP